MSKKLNIILANAPINNGNRGCVALSITTMYLIDKVLSEAGVDYALYLPDSGWTDLDLKTYNIGGKNISYYNLPYGSGLDFKSSAKFFAKRFIEGNLSKKDLFRTADYILDIGQGDSFADIYGVYRFKLIDRIHTIARKHHIPYCILPQTIGPFENSKIKSKAIESIEKATCCMARDKQSYDYVLENVPGQKNVKEYIDVAFFLPYEKIQLDSQYIHVGLNISALLWNGGYTRNNQFNLACDYQQTIYSIIDYFLAQTNVKLHLIAHVVGPEVHVENDYAICYELWRKYNNPNLVLAPFALGPSEIKSYIAGMDFFMGARMHATIAAYSSGVPVVPMAYSRKFNGLFVDTLSYPHMADMKVLKGPSIVQLIIDSFNNRSVLKQEITQGLTTTVEDRKTLLLTDLRQFFGL